MDVVALQCHLFANNLTHVAKHPTTLKFPFHPESKATAPHTQKPLNS